MKLKKIVIEGFRGVPTTLELDLDGKSLCLLGENGHGKTTIVDALEYWSRGEVESFKIAGCGLDATINLDHGPPASVTCERQGHPTLRRRLHGPRGEDVEILGPAGERAVPPPLPLLRHMTMVQFMAETPFQKRAALLRVLGLEPLLDFRAALVTAANAVRHEAEGAEARLADESSVLLQQTGGKPVIEFAKGLMTAAGLQPSLSSESDLLSLRAPTAASDVAIRVDRSDLVDQLARSLEGMSQDAVLGWNKVYEDEQAAVAAAVHDLILAGQRALTIWPDPTCPLCLAPAAKAELVSSLGERAEKLAELKERLEVARNELSAHGSRARTAGEAIAKLLSFPPPNGWPEEAVLRKAAEALNRHGDEAANAVRERRSCPPFPETGIAKALLGIRSAALATQQSPAAAAHAQLLAVQAGLRRVNDLKRVARAKRDLASAASGFLELAEKHVEAAVRDEIGRLGSVAADFYGRLVRNPVYSDASLEYTPKGKGGIEFSLTFNRKHRVSPPQRVVSESQLNALGLAFFLARLKVEDVPWRTLVLDDVVNSFDGNHRMGVAKLLAEEFGDWQILFFTHDAVFVSMSSKHFAGWRFQQIIGWSPTVGPIIDDEDPLKRLCARLDAGTAASELGTLARLALERGLSAPLERLRLPIRFSRHSDFTAHDYRDALDKGLSDRGSPIKDSPVLARMRTANYLTNLSAHDRPSDPLLGTEDLRQLVDDLRELANEFVCSDCGRPVWESQKTKQRDHFQCRCGKLAA